MGDLGFTFYPKDWWASDSFFDLTPIQRYYYLECLFLMYLDNGFIKTQKTQLEKRLQTQILDEDWNIITQKFETIDGKYTHVSVNKRLRKTLANRENGKKGGRPHKNPKNPENNPPLERESKIENKVKDNSMITPKVSKSKTLKDREQEFYNSLIEFVPEFGQKIVRAFYQYWTEPNVSKTKMRFELQKTWDLKRRLENWRKNDKDIPEPEETVKHEPDGAEKAKRYKGSIRW